MKLAAWAFVLALLGCGRADQAEQPVEAERPPDRPLLGSEAVSLIEVFRMPAGGRLELPRDLALDEQGNLYVLDFAAPTELLKYDSTGALILQFAEEGQQGRIVSALEFALAPWGTILLVDRGQNALMQYLTIGFFSGSVMITEGVALDVLALPAFGEFYLHAWDPGRFRSAVYRMAAPFDTLATTYQVAIPPGQPIRKEARDIYFKTAVDSEGRLYVAFRDGYPVRVLLPDGSTDRLVDLDRRGVPKSDETLASEAETAYRSLRSQAPDIADSLLREAAQPDSVWPVVEELVVDPSGRLWVRTHRPDAEGVTPYDVFNERGQLLARVDVPGGVERTAFRPDGRLYVIEAGAGGASIVGYDVLLGEPATGSRGRGESEAPVPTGGSP